MRLQIESTSTIVTIDGVTCRQWNGVTDDGARCQLLVHRIAVHHLDDASEFEAELAEMPEPVELSPPGFAP